MKSYTNHTGIRDSASDINTILQKHLATLLDLYTQVKQAHWNTKGPGFYGIHKMFDDLADPLLASSDTVAERIGALGGYPMGYASAVATNSVLDNPVDDLVQDLDWVAFVLDQYHAYSNMLYVDIGTIGDLDPASEDILIEIVRGIDKGIYFLSSHLEGEAMDDIYETGADFASEEDDEEDEDIEVNDLDDGEDKIV